jgi:NTP pyrophosphatase (non-canonical NTP hydrolase)
MEVIKMNQKEFLDELNKRKDGFILNQNKYYSVVTDSFNTDGGEKKLRIAQEECAELIQAISKYLRYPDCSENRLAVLEELADVCICINYVTMAMKNSYYDVNRAIDIKIERERKRLEEVKNVEEG